MGTEGLFHDMPAHWDLMTLGEACHKDGGDIQCGPFGSQLHASDYVPAGVPFIMPANITDGRISTEGVARISEEDAGRLRTHRLREGDIIGSRRGDLGRTALIRKQEAGWVCGSGCLRIRLGKGGADPLFASYYLRHPAILAWIERHAVGATMPNLNTGIMSALPMHLPHRDEQERIAHILGTLDDKIELNRRMNETLEGMARAFFKSWFVDFDPVRARAAGRKPVGLDPATAALFPDAFQDSEMGKIPKGWAVRKLGDLAAVTPQRSITALYPHQAIEYIDISSVTVGKLLGTTGYVLRDAPSRAKRLVAHGDTIWSCVRPNRKSYLFIHDPAPNLVVSTGFAVLTPKDVPPSYLYAWVTTDAFVEYLSYNADGSAYPAVLPGRFSDAEMLLPSKPILGKFEESVGPMRDRIAHNERESRTLAALRDALMPKLLSGEIRVKDGEPSLERVP